MKISADHQRFDKAMNVILKADPQRVKAEVEAEVLANTAEREARGERKRGRKPKSSSAVRVSSDDVVAVAQEVLAAGPVADITIEDIPLEDVIAELFQSA